MLHWKSKEKHKHVNWGYFFCPRCNNVRPYQLKPASVDFTFYFLPLFDAAKLDEFAVCLLCKKGFDPRTLEPSSQRLLRLAWVAKRELQTNTPDALRSKLLENGLQEPFVDRLILLAQN